MKDLDDENFPKYVHGYCPGCAQFNECLPDKIPFTHAEIKAHIKLLEAQAKLKQDKILQLMDGLGITSLPAPEENGTYYLKLRKDKEYDMATIIEKTNGNLELLRAFMKATKTGMEKIGIDPINIPFTIKTISSWIEFEKELVATKKKETK